MKNYAIKTSLLVTLMVICSLASMAQNPVNTGSKPYVGSTHTYAVASHPGSSYQWFISLNSDGSDPLAHGAEFSIDEPTADYNTKTSDRNKIKVSWSTEGKYYLFVREFSDKDCYEEAVNQQMLEVDVVPNEGELYNGDDPLVETPDTYFECATSVADDQNTTFPVTFRNLPDGATWSLKYTVTKTIGGESPTSEDIEVTAIPDSTYAIPLDYTGEHLQETVFEITITEAKEDKYQTNAINEGVKVIYHIYPLPDTSPIAMDDDAEAL